ncbi:MAG TPA: ABC transporter ATP-binding protein [Candidatus Paceibacterota bacterium]|nr:ABC transporter ATP-binding protein [Candidatus Paceibacterota bacterium]
MNRLRNRWYLSTLGRSARVLSRKDQKKVVAVAALQVFMSGLDLLGVLVIGLLGAVAVSGIESNQPGDRVSAVLRFLHIEDSPFKTQIVILGLTAVLLLVGRTVFSILFTRRILFFLSRRGASISANLVSRLLAQPLLMIQSRTTQETLYSVTRGVEYITLNVLATSVVLVADVSLLVVMGIGLLIVNPTTAIATVVVFSVIGFSLYRLLHVRAGELGLESSRLTISSNEKIVEVFSSYRESIVRNRRDYYAREIGKLRFSLSDTMAEIYFMPFIGKYVIETAVVLGALLIGGVQFIFQDATHAVATLAIFLAAGTRIAPSVLRVQQGSIQIRGGLGAAGPTLDLIESLGNAPMVENVDDTVDVVHEGFVASIEVDGVSLTYPGKATPAIQNISLSIPVGSSVAIVGPSGAGKTTIIDVLLGVLSPDSGTVMVSGLAPLQAVAKWPGAISYVPQDVVISNGSIRENVALGFPPEAATDELVMSALTVASLEDFLVDLPEGIDTAVGERGAKISGGQRQRLGIARAMFTKPHLLVLDEATSSLDGETEASISAAIHALRGSTTVVMIAHRLSTVRNADLVVYMAGGKIMATGTFEEVRSAVPDFDRQAKLMGL